LIEATPEDTHTDVHDMKIDNKIMPIHETRAHAVEARGGGRRRGPGGVAVIVETMTDNNKRTVADVRHAFSKYGGNLGTSGSVAYMFQRKGVLLFAPGIDEDQLLELAFWGLRVLRPPGRNFRRRACASGT
jgi:hypothetical protein